jgi:hypothetical protein
MQSPVCCFISLRCENSIFDAAWWKGSNLWHLWWRPLPYHLQYAGIPYVAKRKTVWNIVAIWKGAKANNHERPKINIPKMTFDKKYSGELLRDAILASSLLDLVLRVPGSLQRSWLLWATGQHSVYPDAHAVGWQTSGG